MGGSGGAIATIAFVAGAFWSSRCPKPQLQLDAGIDSIIKESPHSAQTDASPELVDNNYVASQKSFVKTQK